MDWERDQPPPFGELLRQFRGLARVTQEQLAACVELSPDAISLLERGVRKAPRASTVALLADALGLDPGQRRAFLQAARRRARPRRPPARAGLRPPAAGAAAPPFDALPDPGPLPPGSRMLAVRNPLFVGREADLRRLAAMLGVGGAPERSAVVAVTGMGGIGKTQLAVEFVHRYGRFFAGGVFWIGFANPEEVPRQVAACGGPGFMDLPPGYVDLRPEEQLALVRAAWQHGPPRLLVFDNCEHEALLATWRPPSGSSRVLVTARRSSWDRTLGVEALAVDVLARPESVALLRRFRPDLQPDEPSLDGIARELGDLPLALHLAGSFIDRYRDDVSVDGYLAELRGVGSLAHPSLGEADLLDPTAPSMRLQGVARSFALSYQRLDPDDDVDAAAISLLARAACLAPGEPLARDLLLRTWPAGGAGRRFTDALARLETLGLLERSAGSFRLHRLLVRFVRGLDPDPEARRAVEEALIAYGQLSYQRRLVGLSLLAVTPHLAHVTGAALRQGEDARAASLCNALGQALHGAGDYVAARPYLERALAIRERVLRPDHPDTASSLDGLALLLFDSSELAGARPLLERAIRIREAALGPEHVDTASSLNNLAILLQAQNELASARTLFERSLSIVERALGAEHPRTANALGNLAILLRDQGELMTAEPLLERALVVRERTLGRDHPDTASSLNDLALLKGDLGDLAAAETLHRRALAIRERLLGPDHPRTAQSVNNLARLLRDRGDLAAARPLFERALRIWEGVMGPDHLLTAHALNGLGRLLHKLGELSAARRLHERALAIRERSLGPDSPRTAQSLVNLASLLQAQGEAGAARAAFERALAIHERVLGPDHPRTAIALTGLGLLLREQGEHQRAEGCLRRAFDIRERALGPGHPDTVSTRAALGQCCRRPAAGCDDRGSQ